MYIVKCNVMLAWKNGKRALKFFIIIVCGRRSDSKDIEGKGYFILLRLQS